jgi:gamma-glutamyl hercynylcysteine S-oxide synthase
MTSPSKPTLSDPFCTLPLAQSHTPSLLRQWMQRCRQATLTLFDTIDHATFCHQAHPDFSPVGWHLGHIAYTESLWILERTAGFAPEFREYRQLFAADILPKHDRVYLPPFAEVKLYLNHIRTQVFDYLAQAPLQTQARLWLWLLQHESQHCETISLVLALQNQPQILPAAKMLPAQYQSSIAILPDMVFIPSGTCNIGSNTLDALDNERPTHTVDLESYWIDRYPVTCKQYQTFMEEAKGYTDRQWWSAEGWEWLQSNPVRQPRYWVSHSHWENHPVCGVSWYEADAYARFVGKRLPTEAEWEKSASWNAAQQRSPYPWGTSELSRDRANYFHHVGHTTPVSAYPAGKSAFGCYDMLGNVWEWTDSWFLGYEGFASYPYRGYSQAYFDRQHRVLKGGSWATYPWALRIPFRNWYHPHVREVFAGFRCAR